MSKRLGHANPTITMSIYAHELEADELVAAKSPKIQDDSMRQPERMLANVSAEGAKKLEGIEKEKTEIGGDDGARTRDLRRDRPAF